MCNSTLLTPLAHSLMIRSRYVPQFEIVRRLMLFVPCWSQPWAPKQLTPRQRKHQHHHAPHHTIDDVEVNYGEDVEGTMTPSVGFEQCWSEIGPFDPQDPVVAQCEPGYEEECEGERSGLGAVGGGVGGADLQAAGMQLIVQDPGHFDGTDATANHHIDRDVGFAGAIA